MKHYQCERQTGAALIVSLVIATALAVFSLSTQRNIGVEAAMTRNAWQLSAAKRAARSAINEHIAPIEIPPTINQIHTSTYGPYNEFEISTQVIYLGETTVPPGYSAASADSGFITHHYEIQAVARGLRHTETSQRQGFYIVSANLNG